MENAKISNLYDLNETIAKEYLEQFTYPWEALKGISEFIKKLGPTLDPEKFEKRGEDIWVAKSAKVAPTACLNGPLIIDEEAEIRHCAFVRGSAWSFSSKDFHSEFSYTKRHPSSPFVTTKRSPSPSLNFAGTIKRPFASIEC